MAQCSSRCCCCEALASIDHAVVSWQCIELAPQTRSKFERALPGYAATLRRRLSRQNENGHVKKHSKSDPWIRTGSSVLSPVVRNNPVYKG